MTMAYLRLNVCKAGIVNLLIQVVLTASCHLMPKHTLTRGEFSAL